MQLPWSVLLQTFPWVPDTPHLVNCAHLDLAVALPIQMGQNLGYGVGCFVVLSTASAPHTAHGCIAMAVHVGVTGAKLERRLIEHAQPRSCPARHLHHHHLRRHRSKSHRLRLQLKSHHRRQSRSRRPPGHRRRHPHRCQNYIMLHLCMYIQAAAATCCRQGKVLIVSHN